MRLRQVSDFAVAPTKFWFRTAFTGNIRRRDFLKHPYTGEPARSASIMLSREKEITFSDLPTEVREWAQSVESSIANPAGRTWCHAAPDMENEPKTGKEFYITLSLQESAPVLENSKAEPDENAMLIAEQSRQRQFTLRRVGTPGPGATITYYVGDDAKTGVVFWCAIPICR